MKRKTILKGNGFLLRPYKKVDAKSITKNANNKKIARNMNDRFPQPYALKDARNWIKINQDKYRKQKYIASFVIDVEGKAVGTIELSIKASHEGSLGYWLGEKYWGRGIVSEAVKLITAYGFKKLKLRRIYAAIFPWNKASKKVLLRNYFKFEGVLKKGNQKDGRFIDDYLFAKVK